MKPFFLILCVTSIFTLQSTFSFEYFELWVTWPKSFCSLNKCISTTPQAFTIHGLWPILSNGVPAPNVSSAELNLATLQERLKSITSDLDKEWPNLRKGRDQTNSAFWLYEWNKHGTASSSTLPVLSYFQKALELHRRHNIVDILGRNRATPSDVIAYYPDKLYSFLDSAIGAGKYFIECQPITIDGNKIQLLHQVAVCYDKNASALTNCYAPKVQSNKNFCGKCIWFPKSTVTSVN